MTGRSSERRRLLAKGALRAFRIEGRAREDPREGLVESGGCFGARSAGAGSVVGAPAAE